MYLFDNDYDNYTSIEDLMNTPIQRILFVLMVIYGVVVTLNFISKRLSKIFGDTAIKYVAMTALCLLIYFAGRYFDIFKWYDAIFLLVGIGNVYQFFATHTINISKKQPPVQ